MEHEQFDQTEGASPSDAPSVRFRFASFTDLSDRNNRHNAQVANNLRPILNEHDSMSLVSGSHSIVNEHQASTIRG